MKIYLDACCLNRPFDEQSQDRIRLEAEAILLIIKHFENTEWTWLGSEVLNFELKQIPDSERWQRVKVLIKHIHSSVRLDATIIERAQQLEGLGFKAFNALHVSCAEKSQADVLLSTDDQLVRLANRFSEELKLKVSNPLIWLNEVIKE